MSDHSNCEHVNFPPCVTDDPRGTHGPSSAIIGLTHAVTGDTYIAFLCIQCYMMHGMVEKLSQSMGIPFVGILNNAISRSSMKLDAAIDLVSVLREAHPLDPVLVELEQTLRQQVDATVIPMASNEIAALFARTNTDNPENEEVN